jgi:hypothetical protein
MRELPAGDAVKRRRYENASIRIIAPGADPGELLHAVLQGWILGAVSDATLLQTLREPPLEGRRGGGIQAARASRFAVSDRLRFTR